MGLAREDFTGNLREGVLSIFTWFLNVTVCYDIEKQKIRKQKEFDDLRPEPESYKRRMTEFQIERLIENSFSTEKCNRLIVLMTFFILIFTILMLVRMK